MDDRDDRDIIVNKVGRALEKKIKTLYPEAGFWGFEDIRTLLDPTATRIRNPKLYLIISLLPKLEASLPDCAYWYVEKEAYYLSHVQKKIDYVDFCHGDSAKPICRIFFKNSSEKKIQRAANKLFADFKKKCPSTPESVKKKLQRVIDAKNFIVEKLSAYVPEEKMRFQCSLRSKKLCSKVSLFHGPKWSSKTGEFIALASLEEAEPLEDTAACQLTLDYFPLEQAKAVIQSAGLPEAISNSATELLDRSNSMEIDVPLKQEQDGLCDLPRLQLRLRDKKLVSMTLVMKDLTHLLPLLTLNSL